MLLEEESTALVYKMIGAIIGFINVDADYSFVMLILLLLLIYQAIIVIIFTLIYCDAILENINFTKIIVIDINLIRGWGDRQGDQDKL